MTVLNSKEVAEYEIAMSKISCTNNNGICMHCAGTNLIDTITDRDEQIEVLEDLIFQLRLKLNRPLPAVKEIKEV